MSIGGSSRSLWRVESFGEAYLPPADGDFYDNRRREPRGMVVFQYVTAGEMIYRDATGRYVVGPDSAAMFSHGEASSYGVAAPSRQRFATQWVGLRGAGLLEHVNDLRRAYGSVFRFEGDHAVRDVMRELMRSADPRAACDPLVLAEQVHQFILRLMRHAQQTRQQSLTPVERAIDDLLRFPVSTWSLKDLARRHRVSREHLSRVFTERHGQSPGAYLAAKRFRRATELLRQTSLPVAAIARQAGYGSAHSLARHLRQTVGMSPTEYRCQRRLRPLQSTP